MAAIRINRYVASSGAISRRKADELIEAGRVRINGKPARLGDVIDPAHDEVRLDGRPIASQRTCILALYKPRNMLTTMSDPKGRPCIRDLVPRQFQGVFPVGRLDYDAEGLLILTNDGDLAHALHHPSFQVPKVYVVKVTPRATAEGIEQMEQGVILDGKKTLPARIVHVHAGADGSTLRFTLHQGLKNQIKRMASSVGLKVVSLKRISIGPLVLKGMAPGEIRELSAQEARSLHKILKKH
ncbi:MAG TPA: pseudouridine synthase [Deltaproteobacteria bacterium]|nr:pseudouridine synthase [Deltaproteobacteria bacterium]HQI80379.1 pseudouridine synthase [Deltaproteobacteria bacterium]